MQRLRGQNGLAFSWNRRNNKGSLGGAGAIQHWAGVRRGEELGFKFSIGSRWELEHWRDITKCIHSSHTY